MKAVLICNPRAGKHQGDGALQPAIEVLERSGWSICLQNSTGPGHATSLARTAVSENMDAVLVAGGDGTLNEAAQALVGTSTALGYLPYGTVNIWARETRTPLRPLGAARAIVDGRIEQIDAGIANDRYFLLMAGIGFDGEVVRRAKALEQYKRRFGIAPYILAGIGSLPFYRGADVELRYSGVIRRLQALMVVVSNTRLYGGRFHFTPKAIANDGWLDVCIVKGRGPLATVRQSLPLLLTGGITYSDVEFFRVNDLSVQTDVPLLFQLDGELEGTTPVQFHLAPRALRVIVPAGFDSDLIS